MSHAVVIDAAAKVNLFLRVLHRRDDGYREVETLMQSVSLADEVRVSIADSGPSISLAVDGPDLGPPEANLAFRAATRLREVTGFEAAVDIRLTKRIPAGAGLGGGSSDAAAVLKCLSALTDLHDRDVLLGIARDLGSDVSFFLGESPLALGRGRGEVLTPLAPLPEAHLVLALPPVHVSTVDAFEALSPVDGITLRDGPRELDFGAGLDWERVAGLAENDFEGAASKGHPEIRSSLEGLRAEGATVALLSGSGGASFGLFTDAVDAEDAASVLTERYRWPFLPVVTLSAVPRLSRVNEGA